MADEEYAEEEPTRNALRVGRNVRGAGGGDGGGQNQVVLVLLVVVLMLGAFFVAKMFM
jgi:hypothetical protein